MSNNVKKLENQCEARDKEIESLKQIVKNMESYHTKLKYELVNSDEERNRLKTWHIPRLKETRKYQKELAEELQRIKKDAELLPQVGSLSNAILDKNNLLC